MIPRIDAGIVDTPLVPDQRTAGGDDRCGAVVDFVGVVRERDAGRRVAAIDYSAHPSATGTLRAVAERFARSPGVHAVRVWHRTGRLVVGDVVMVVSVAAEHRAQAFGAAQAIVDAVKAQVPVWKRQEFADGTHAWSGLP